MNGIDFEKVGFGSLAELLGAAKIGISILSPDGEILDIDRVSLGLLEPEGGSDAEAVKGKNVADILPNTPLAGHVRASGFETLDGRVFEFNYRTPRGTHRKIRQHIVARTAGQEGRPIFCVFTTDISNGCEEKAARGSYDQPNSSKWEALKRVTGKAAHDMNNLLAAIKGYSDVILLDLHESDPMRADVEGIGEATARAYDITNKLLLFARKQSAKPTRVNINQMFLESQEMLSRVLGPSISLELRLDKTLRDVEIDTRHLELIVQNIVSNAAEAMPEGGKLIIETYNKEVTEAESADAGVARGHYAVVRFSDNGEGIDEELHEKIFEPFFSSREHGRGSGLGLSVVRGIVQHAGGNIYVKSALGRGSSFEILLRATDRPVDTAAKVDSSIPQGGGTSVLVVDDDDLLRSIVERILSRSGYEVHIASTRQQALALCRDEKTHIDVALIDIVMPEIDGRDLSAQIRTVRPDTKILYMSGFSKETLTQQGVLDEEAELIRKPFPADQLSSRILALLSS